MRAQRAVSLQVGIGHLLEFVDVSIELDDQRGLGAEEVDDELSQRVLTVELRTLELPTADNVPQDRLGNGRALALVASSLAEV